jgi:hypothetical protein
LPAGVPAGIVTAHSALIVLPGTVQPTFPWHCCTEGATSNELFKNSAWQVGFVSEHLAMTATRTIAEVPGASEQLALLLASCAASDVHVSPPHPARTATKLATVSRRYLAA